jgi:UDP-N-acetylglucosamine 4-epimerase
VYALAFQKSYGLQSIGLRYFNVFGRRQDPEGAYAAVIPRWITTLLRGEECVIFGDGETTRDFCYVRNVVQANILSAVAPAEATSDVYNIACGRSVTLNELFAMLRDRVASEEAGVALAQPRYEPFRNGDVRFSTASIDRAQSRLGYAPLYPVEEGLEEAGAWYVRQARAGLPSHAQAR